MQNPSHGVAQLLQNHVHLISGHRFPLIASLSLDQAFRYLIDAPQIVKALAPMSWTYVQAPQDGTLWLEWLTSEKNEGRFPSDGYVWGDTEQTYRQEFGGYTVEFMVHTLGYRIQYDHMASHARTRYHLVNKNPSVNAAPPDPSLWLVHYHQAENNRVLPSNQVPFTPQMRQFVAERTWLESQGTLEKKDFMLHDRSSWPSIDVPSKPGMHAQQMRQPGMYGTNLPQARMPFYPQTTGQPSNAKRQKMNPPMAGAAPDGMHDTSIEDEEKATLGDFFDHLTPRDISMTRYMQHHRWMEEVFSSPYASAQIVPADLGLGLMGELKGLTEGILQPPSLDFSGDKAQTSRAKEAQPFTNLKKEQLEDFNKRVEKHLEEGQAEIEKMKADHAAKMAEWKKSSKLMQAEKRLRYATWEGHESAVPAFRFEEPAASGHGEEGAKREALDDVVKDVEGLLGVKISTHKEASMIEKGGLEKEEEPPRDPIIQSMPVQQQRQRPVAAAATANSIPEAQTYHSDPLPPAGAESEPHVAPSMPQQQHVQAQSTIGQPQASLYASSMAVAGDTSMEGMDLDVNNNSNGNNVSNFDFGDEQLASSGIDNDTSMAAAMQSSTQQNLAAMSKAPSSAATSAQAALLQPLQSSHNATVGPAGMGAAGDGDGADNTSMFDNSAFDDFTNMDDTAGDGMMFEGGGDMGDDMFGEAIHGMDPGDDQDDGGRSEGDGGLGALGGQ
ncbi:hypothetical protein LTR36_008631 [Oleoguttula mirabilis]|uniref:DUF1750-domain-containing protein n=1 Tax=Oleoguttula mirabilis TaxID=1507867 RepID=A0AAV9JTK8_9PEZI|nr:hypothetical protein LTR36_008631 [Oleoguttula mirabilis]